MQDILDEHTDNDNCGVDRMIIALSWKGIKVGRRRGMHIMREHGWFYERKPRPKGMSKATTEIRGKENLIKQDFTSDKSYCKLLADISQIACKDGKLYISSIMDCFNREILSLVMRSNIRKELCIDTLLPPLIESPLKGAICHGDRGSQYTSEAFRNKLTRRGIIQSLSGVHHCFDNARMESFFATLKKELLYRISTYKMEMDVVKSLIFRYVFTYYNTVRIYTSNLDGLPPAAYRRSLEQKIRVA